MNHHIAPTVMATSFPLWAILSSAMMSCPTIDNTTLPQIAALHKARFTTFTLTKPSRHSALLRFGSTQDGQTMKRSPIQIYDLRPRVANRDTVLSELFA